MERDDPARLEAEQFRTLAIDELTSVHRFALHLVGRPEEAEDLVQQTYLRAFEAWTTFRAGSPMRPWLFKILHNVHRSRARRPSAKNVPIDDVSADDAPASGDDRREHIDWERVDEQLKRAVLGLKPELLEVFLLHASEQLKYREIAEVLQIPIGTVMSRLSRARKVILADLRSGDSTDGKKTVPERIVPRRAL